MSDTARPTGPRAISAIEIIRSLAIDDSSLASIATCIKRHSVDHGMWIAYERDIYHRKLLADRQIEEKEAELVSRYAQTAKSASAISLYAKYEMQTHPEIKRMRRMLIELEESLSFVRQVGRLFSKRADLLTVLLKLDHDVIIHDRKDVFDLNVELREGIRRYNTLMDRMNKPWVRDVE